MSFRAILWPVGWVLTIALAIGARILDGIDAASLGLPFWAWEGIGLTLFFAMVLAVLYKRLKPLTTTPRPPAPASPTRPTTPVASVEEKELAGVFRTMRADDKEDIKHRVPLHHVDAGIEYIRETGYCGVHFVFVFINATVYRVDVRQVIGGDVYANGNKLPEKLVMQMERKELIFPHAIGFGLRCFLQIKEPYLQELIKLSGKTVQLELHSVKIEADLINPAGDVAGEFALPIPSCIVLDVPDLITQNHGRALHTIDLSREGAS